MDKNKIKAAFLRTWDTIAGDIYQAVADQAEAGDREAKKALKTGPTNAVMYEAAVDYLSIYARDQQALDEWKAWRNSDYQGARREAETWFEGRTW